MGALRQDVGYALRTLRKSPGFAAVAILTLGLGIGATTAIFSVINAVLLRPLPYAAPDRLVTVEHFYPSLNNMEAPVSVPGFRDYSAQQQLFSSAAVEQGWAPNLTGEGEPERLGGLRVTGDYFKTFGVPALVGRGLLPEDAVAGRERVVVLGHGLWQRLFAGDRNVVGRSLQLDGQAHEIIGVMPESFRGFWARRAELWTPLVFQPDQFSDNARTNEFLNFAARLQDGVTVEQARGEMHALATRLKADFPDQYAPTWDLHLTTLPEEANGGSRRALYVLLGAVTAVLLIACANVANLQLARAAGRGREIAVRVALGASPAALLRQLLVESLVLALAGGALGVLLAVWGVPALLSLNSGAVTPSPALVLDARVLGFALGISLLTGLLFGLVPALRVSRTSVADTMKDGARGAAGDRGGLTLRRGLVVATVALALTLLVGAGLLVRSFARLLGVDPGFNPERVLTFNVALPAASYPNDTVRVAFFERATAAIGAVPGVTAVGGTSVLPFGGSWATGSFTVEGYQTPANTPGPWGDIRLVTPGFIEVLEIPLRQGRGLTAEDRAGGPRVVVVDEEMVQRYWPNEDPIGKRITFNNPGDSAIIWIEVVGVVGHTMHEGLDGGRRVQLYLPIAQVPIPFLAFAVRTAGEPLAALPAVKAAIGTVDRNLPVANSSSLETLIEGTTGPRRFSMVLLTLFSGLAALLAAIGLYGVMAYTVTQRTRELGVRLALGASARDLLGLVVGQGMRLVVLGVGIGLLAALGLSRLLTTMLFGVRGTDILTYTGITVLLLAVTAFATWLPARRATRVDPAVVLRED